MTTPKPELREARLNGRTVVWLEVALDPDWTAAYLLDRRGGLLEIIELRVFPSEPDRPKPGRWSGRLSDAVPAGGITARVLRKVRVSTDLASVTAIANEVRQMQGDEAVWRRFGGQYPELAEDQPRRPGRRGRSDVFLVRVAARYLGLIEDRVPNPVPVLTAELKAKGTDFPEATVRGFLHEARRRDLLSRSPKGKAGGDLTAKGEDLLITAALARTKKWPGPKKKSENRPA